MNIRKKLLSALCAWVVLLPFALTATSAYAQQATSAPALPRIHGFDVDPATRLTAGHDLVFTLYGSPGGIATVRINGAVDRFPLEEVEAGVYEGTYTIKSRDRIDAETAVTANLRLGNRIATELLDESLLYGALARSEVKLPLGATAQGTAPKIDGFEVDPVNRLDFGTNLHFTVAASPGGIASIRISGVKGKISLSEVQYGVYEGVYAIKERDRVSANSVATVTLRVGERNVSAILATSLLSSSTDRQPRAGRALRNCGNCGVIESINLVEVNGNGSYLGTIAGGLVGAVIGSQIGSGGGKSTAQIVGALGGAVAGNEIEKRVNKTRHFDVVARLRDGGVQTISYATEPSFKVGDRIRVENGTLVPDL